MLTDVCASDDIEATARRTGFVKRASKLTGKLFLALVTCGTWHAANTTLAQLAAKVAPLDTQVDVSPEAIHQRRHKTAMAFLQDMIRQALATTQSLERVCEDGLLTFLTKVYSADSPGFALPEALHKTLPGSGGSAAKAGAKIQAVGDYKSRVLGHFALTPWHIPAQRYVDTVVALAPKGLRFIVDVGYLKVKAFASMATAGAYFCCRLTHQTTMYETVAGRVGPVKLAECLLTVAPDLLCLEKAISIGATERVASRLMAVRRPEAVVNARRSIARKHAKQKGYTPAHAHLPLMAWNLFLTNVPDTLWQTDTVVKGYPWRWHIERMFKSWKSSRHLAALTTKKADTT